MKLEIKKVLGAGCEVFRIGPTASRFRPGRFVILAFHRVVDTATMLASGNKPLMVEEKTFSQIAKILAEKCLCLPLSEVLRRSQAGECNDRPMVAITFDDGYGECYQKAFPILRRFGLPATVFLATGYIDDPSRFFWWDAVEQYMSNHLDMDELSRAGLSKELIQKIEDEACAASPEKVEAFIRGPLVRLDPEERKIFLGLAQGSAASRPAMLTWDQVREMTASGLVSFGAHTVSHPFLDELNYEDALQEIITSKQRIEKSTGQPVTSLAYPAGRVPGCVKSMLSRAVIPYAVTTSYGDNDATTDPLLLKRMDARFCLAGEEFIPSYFMAHCWGCLNWLH
jgi:peptidoglycan/xylan/chitin deacetylase (PgdA/CDA1 family)